MKDGTTHLAYKPEHAVIWTPARWRASYTRPTRATRRAGETLAAAKENLEPVDAAPTAEDPAECVTDKGYHSRSS